MSAFLSGVPLGWLGLLLLIAVSGLVLMLTRWDMHRQERRRADEAFQRQLTEALEQLLIDILFTGIINRSVDDA